MTEPIRIAMWSGPRNISTAMMRAFDNRGDTAVIDEPFYAAYLAATGIDHPMRDAVLASQPDDFCRAVEGLLGPVEAPIQYQKHITTHMLPDLDLAWMAQCRSAFLIRDPARVVASYVRKRASVTLADIGVVRQWELFRREADRLGAAPPVLDAEDVLADPAAALSALCAALKIPFTNRMLRWPAGRRATDGVWAVHWYGAVERSTGFSAPEPDAEERLAVPVLADAARPYYEELRLHRLRTARADAG